MKPKFDSKMEKQPLWKWRLGITTLLVIFLGFGLVAFLVNWKVRPVSAATITITNSGGTYSPVNRANLQRAFDNAQCGDEIQIEAGSFVRTGGKIESIVKTGAEAIINFPYAHGLEVGEGFRVDGIQGFGTGLNTYYDVIALVSENAVKVKASGLATDGIHKGENANVYTTLIHFNYDPDKKSCAEGNEIVVTTTKKEWLPDPDMRITPSYKPLIPTLQLVGHHSNNPLLQIHDEVKGLKLVGVGFQKVGLNTLPSSRLIDVGHSDFPKDFNQLTDRITFDRTLFYNDFILGNTFRQAISLRTKKVAFINNFVENHMGLQSDSETYVWASINSTGPFTIRNNYTCCAISVPFLWGGYPAAFTSGTPIPSDITIEHNYFYTSMKHYPTSPTYVGDAYHGVVKNCVELKVGLRASLKWNGCENSFSGGGSQWYGFVFTPRANTEGGGGTCTLDSSRKVATCPGANHFPGFLPGHMFGMETGGKNYQDRYQWRTVVTADNLAKVFTFDEPFDKVSSSTVKYALSFTPWWKIENVTAYGNFFRNVASPFLILGQDELLPASSASDLLFKNNLSVWDSPYFKPAPGIDFVYSQLRLKDGGKNIQYLNNTGHNRSTFKPNIEYPRTLLIETTSGFYGPLENLKYENNLARAEYYGGSEGILKDVVKLGQITGLSLRNNSIPGWESRLFEPCPPATCAGNFFNSTNNTFDPQFKDPDKNDFSLLPSSPYAGKGTNGTNLGVEIDDVAAIRNLKIDPLPNALLFSWRLPIVMRDMGCSLEVSPDQNLVTDLGTYKVVDALRPDYFMRADSDRSNKRATKSEDGLDRWFQVGENSSETDDTGADRNLGLTPDTVYYYRLMCGGATERGSAKTLSNAVASTHTASPVPFNVKAKSAKGSKIRPRFGSNRKALTTGLAVSCSSGCTISMTARLGRQFLYYLDETDDAGSVVALSRRPVVVPFNGPA